MAVKLFRIDDRLVHGQIMFSWMKEVGADTVVVADDAVAKDPVQQMCLKLVVPRSVNLIMKPIKEVAQELKEDKIPGNIILLLREPAGALELIKEGFTTEYINLGNISNSPSELPRKRLLKNIFAHQVDADSIRQLSAAGVKVAIQLIPGDPVTDALELINSNF